LLFADFLPGHDDGPPTHCPNSRRLDPSRVSEMLGHGGVRITLSTYQDVLPSMGADAGAALSALVL
jgi:hypothetical protein